MLTKISEAAMIAKLGIDVYIVKVSSHIFNYMRFYSNRTCACSFDVATQAATDHSARALKGQLRGEGDIPGDWLGTVIRLAK